MGNHSKDFIFISQMISLVVENRQTVNNFFSMAFSVYLRSKREAAGMSQQRLADLITARGHNVTAGSISNIERAYYKKQDGSESQPDKSFVINAAEVLNLDVDEALVEADYAPLNAGALSD